jgi:hypothetical protein
MSARLGRMPFAWGWVLCAVTSLAAEPSPNVLQRLASELGAPNFATREQALAALIAAGGQAIEPLTNCLRTGSPEASWRATDALIQIAINGDDGEFARAIAALSQTRGTTVRLSNLAELRAKQALKRRESAAAAIRSFGGLLGVYVDEPAALSLKPEPLEPASPLSTTTITDALDQGLPTFAVLQPQAPAQPESPPAPAAPPELPADELAALLQCDPAKTEPPPGVSIADAYVSPDLEENDVPIEAELALTLNALWQGGDDGLSNLRHLPDIVSVRLDQAQVSDAALNHISVLPRLKDMRIHRSPFSPTALGRFRQRHPNVSLFVTELAMPLTRPAASSQAANR